MKGLPDTRAQPADRGRDLVKALARATADQASLAGKIRLLSDTLACE
jgi:hypothetical protein